MAKRQTRRSISVSRSTYERLRAYCETNEISMSQFVEHRVGDFLGRSIRRPAGEGTQMMATTEMSSLSDRREAVPSAPVIEPVKNAVVERELQIGGSAPQPAPVVATAPVQPVPTRTTIVQRPAPAAPPPAKLKPDQIFTF